MSDDGKSGVNRPIIDKPDDKQNKQMYQFVTSGEQILLPALSQWFNNLTSHIGLIFT